MSQHPASCSSCKYRSIISIPRGIRPSEDHHCKENPCGYEFDVLTLGEIDPSNSPHRKDCRDEESTC
jgi:hypothetical protein